MSTQRLHPNVVEALRLLDTLPAEMAHGYWIENGKLTDRPLTADDIKRALIEGEYTPEEIRRHVALMRWAIGGAR